MVLEEERISIAFLIGDDPNNWPLAEMTGLMEILGLEEYFKTKVTLGLTNSLFEIGFHLVPFSWNQWKITIAEIRSTCQSKNLHLTSRIH